MDESSELMTPSEVAAVFRVNPKTITRWAREGRIPHIRTVGGHRRYPRRWVERELSRLSNSGSEKQPNGGGTSTFN